MHMMYAKAERNRERGGVGTQFSLAVSNASSALLLINYYLIFFECLFLVSFGLSCRVIFACRF